jgi:hypothetical protein
LILIAGLVPATHKRRAKQNEIRRGRASPDPLSLWMAGPSPAMTILMGF